MHRHIYNLSLTQASRGTESPGSPRAERWPHETFSLEQLRILLVPGEAEPSLSKCAYLSSLSSTNCLKGLKILDYLIQPTFHKPLSGSCSPWSSAPWELQVHLGPSSHLRIYKTCSGKAE